MILVVVFKGTGPEGFGFAKLLANRKAFASLALIAY